MPTRPRRVLAVTEGKASASAPRPRAWGRMTVEPIVVIDSPDLPPLWQVFGARAAT